MTITQTVEIPEDRRIFLELPSSVPSGVRAKVEVNIPAYEGIDEVRQLLQKEMSEKGTISLLATSGNGWEAHVRELYAES